MKRLSIFFVILTALFSASITTVCAAMTNYGIEPREAYIEVGQTIQLHPYYETDDGSTRNPMFYVDSDADHDVVELGEGGMVMGKKVGDTTINCGFREEGESSFYFSRAFIHVIDPVTTFEVPQSTYTLYLHQWELDKKAYSFKPEINVVPDTLQPTFTLDNDNGTVEISYDGSIRPIGYGTEVVTATIGRQSREITINVRDKDKESYTTFKETTQDPVFPESSGPIYSTTMSGNVNGHEYSRNWANPVNSYLVKADKGYMTVGRTNDQVVVTYFNNSYEPIAEKTVGFDLPLFGGFYNGTDNFFLVFGQNNPNQSDDTEVLRIVKYDKNWNKISSASVKGANTVYPFDAGSLDMAQSGDMLYVRTCHEMYTSSDGLNHQANMAYEVNIPTMEVTGSNYEVSNSGYGYVSHSFNQYLLEDKGDIISLDHGDAYPRSALLGFIENKSNNSSTNNYYSESVLDFAGEIGQNYTGATLGGLAASDDNYFTVGSSIDQNNPSSQTRNVYITVTPKRTFGSDSNSSIKWITQNSSGTAGNPYIVKMGTDNFLVLWQYAPDGTSYQQLQYTFVDGNGNPKGSVKSADGLLSDCEPIFADGKATWLVSQNGGIDFYTIDTSGNLNKTSPISSAVPIYRLYNAGNGEHLYTSNAIEAVTLIQAGWTDEGTGWFAPSSGQPVYRLYNEGLQNHLYTTDEHEVDVLTTQHGWIKDFNGEPIFYSGGDVPIYRVYNEQLRGLHHLTTDEHEYNVLPTVGWTQEGIAFRAISK